VKKPMKGKILVLTVGVFILASSHLAEAQQPAKQIPRIGFMSSAGAPGSPAPLFDAFRQGLRDLGYVDGKNIVIVHRYAEGRLDWMPPFVHETSSSPVMPSTMMSSPLIKESFAEVSDGTLTVTCRLEASFILPELTVTSLFSSSIDNPLERFGILRRP